MSNGVQSGLKNSQPYVFLEQIASGWQKSDRLDILVLRAICNLSVTAPDQAGNGFTSQEIVEEVSRLRGRHWSSQDNKDQMSDDVRRQWNNLLGTWQSKIEGIQQHLADKGIGLEPRPEKSEGGGSGRLSRYRVEWLPLGEGAVHTQVAPNEDTSAGAIKYVCEDIEDAGLVARLFTKGYHVAGWRRWLLAIFLGLPMTMLFIMFIYMLFGITLIHVLEVKTTLHAFLSFIVVFIAAWITIGPILELPLQRIVSAPWWLQSDIGDRLLEYRCPPRYPVRSMKAVRYTGTCPTCGGKVLTKSNIIEFNGRVVGRCENTPKEHVYSFDHITRLGKPLR